MTLKEITDPYVLKPVLTADGRPWTQRCYVCTKTVNFLKGDLRVHVGPLVRHKKCHPPALAAGTKEATQ